jgi:protein pelota
MQLVGTKSSQRLDDIGEGSLTLLPTDPEDMVR